MREQPADFEECTLNENDDDDDPLMKRGMCKRSLNDSVARVRLRVTEMEFGDRGRVYEGKLPRNKPRKQLAFELRSAAAAAAAALQTKQRTRAINAGG